MTTRAKVQQASHSSSSVGLGLHSVGALPPSFLQVLGWSTSLSGLLDRLEGGRWVERSALAESQAHLGTLRWIGLNPMGCEIRSADSLVRLGV